MRLHGLMVGVLLAGGCATVVQEKAAVAPRPNGKVVAATAWAKASPGGDAFEAGRQAAANLKAKLGGVEPQVIVLSECFANKADKSKAARGVASVFGKERVAGISSYGFYTRDGVADREAVGLLALGGEGVTVRMAFVPKQNSVGLAQDSAELKTALGEAGRKLALQLPVTDQSRLMIVLADTHSPKNQLLLDGIQSVVGTAFPITGGSVNKNDGQNWVHWKGGLYADAALALMIDGNISVAMNGAQARDNDAVLATANQVAKDLTTSSKAYATAQLSLPSSPARTVAGGLFLAFDCAGRKGKIDSLDDARKAVVSGLSEGKRFETSFTTDEQGNRIETEKEVPYRLSYGGPVPSGARVRLIDPKFSDAEVFGMWCAGEFGSAEDSLEQPVGRGWHIMGTVIGQRNATSLRIVKAD